MTVYSILSIIIFICIQFDKIPEFIMKWNIDGMPIISFLVYLGLFDTMFIFFKLFLKIDLFFFLDMPSIIWIVFSYLFAILSICYWGTIFQYIFIGFSLLISSPDKKYVNTTKIENISVSIIRYYGFFCSIIFLMTKEFRMLLIN
jgi:hypothetical protein